MLSFRCIIQRHGLALKVQKMALSIPYHIHISFHYHIFHTYQMYGRSIVKFLQAIVGTTL